jgi:hypothetical protein
VLDRAVFTDLTLHSVITPAPIWRKCIREGCCLAAVVRSAWETTKQVVNLSVHQDGGCHRTGILEILETEAIIADISVP